MSKQVSEDEKLNKDAIEGELVVEDEPIVENEENQSFADEDQVSEVEKPAAFFHVGITKFAIMFVATLGMYQLYWFYKQWSGLKQYYQLDAWPVARSFFAIFFTHSLCTYTNEYIKEDNREYQWQSRGNATSYVALIILGAILSQLYDHFSDILLVGIASVAATLISCIPLLQIQRAINVALQGSHYEINDKLTWQNGVWIAIGATYWFVVSLGIYATYANLS